MTDRDALIARLREHARLLDLVNEPAGASEALDIADAFDALSTPPPAPPSNEHDNHGNIWTRVPCTP